MKNFSDLTEQELLALAIALEVEDNRTYSDLAEAMRESYPGTARMFAAMGEEEDGHRHRLLDLYRKKFGDHIPLIRRQDVKGFLERKSLWLLRPLGLEKARAQAELMEAETKRFYQKGARQSTDAAIRQLLGDLAAEERRHEARAEELEAQYVPAEVEKEEGESERRLFLLQIVQPGLAGLMDGSVSTLAPLFAAAFATRATWPTFLVGLAAAIGAGISMGFAEALSDNGSLTGRGSPWGPRPRLRRDDRARRARAHLAVPGALLHGRDDDRRRGRGRRTRGDLVGPQPLHGHADAVGGVSGLRRRPARFRDRHRNRQRIRRHHGLRGLFPTAAG
jgi:rubrerythrin